MIMREGYSKIDLLLHCEELAVSVEAFDLDWPAIKSGYNPGAWTALSLRGHSPDPTDVGGKRGNVFHQTPLWNMFPEVASIIDLLQVENLAQVRLMRLMPGGGLPQHTDTTVPENLRRLHVPVQTNPDAWFTVWVNEIKTSLNMQVGECWELDVRTPHAVVNLGTIDRIHLVIDEIT